ncbi:hypothetical protein HO133_003144 [Letharia lupina]|uniref:Uncharacterized protein n=1 Tax=Letharia lupina TaxID=560253 RepID=A0A8H6CCE8_9LECA|nr:uncharacterized protein HO133_003144 [Letharia lupina]KAF6220711.1 hypothetical protein HO133_003144 [Letharia lupina]
MSLAQHIWDAVLDLVETIGALEDHDILEVVKTEPDSTYSLPSVDLHATSAQACSTDKENTGIVAWIEPQHSGAVQDFAGKDVSVEEVTSGAESGLESTNDTDLRDQNDEHQQENSGPHIGTEIANLITHRIDPELIGQNWTLRQDNVQHLKWQDKASMTIKKMTEEAEARKHEVRDAKKAAVRARAAMQRQIDDLERQVQESERDKDTMLMENARATDAHESSLRESKYELEAQKEAAAHAAAAAERQITGIWTKHNTDMAVAEAKIKELRAAQTFTFDCNREANALREELSEAKKERVEELAAKDEEIKTLQTCIYDRDSEIRRLGAEAEDDCKAKREAIKEKDGVERAKLAADREIKKLKVENEALESKRGKADSKALEAGGRAKGLQDQLVVTEKRAAYWESLCTKKEEDAKDKVLSAYNVDQQPTFIPSGEEGVSVLVEQLRKENGELREKIVCLTDDIQEWARAWEAAVQGQKMWEQDIRRRCDEEKQEALDKERAKCRVTDGRDAREQDIRRECEEEKQKALAAEREIGRVQSESRTCSLRGQFAVKLKSHSNRELQRLRRRTGVEHKKQMKVRKCQVRWVFNRAVSRAVEVERSLLQTQSRTQFETEIASYKTQFESEHAISQTQSGAQNDTGPLNQVLLHEEVKKRDGYIELHKARLKEAFDAKRESESTLKTVRAENERLSRDVVAYENQKALARQTKSGAQITLMAQELARALKLFNEIATLGLDEKHRNLLNELVLANKAVRDIRSTIEEGAVVDYEDFQGRLDRVVASSDAFDYLDPRERPALHAQLVECYAVIGGLTKILAGERGDVMKEDILERIYRNSDKGKGKQGAVTGSGPASGPSFGANGGLSAAPLLQLNGNSTFPCDLNDNPQTPFSNTSTSNSTQKPTERPFTTTPKPTAPGSQNEPEYMDAATAHALQGTDASIQDAAIVQNQLHRQDGTEMDLSPLSGPLSLQERVQGPEQPAGWTDVMTGWVRYLLQQGTELSAVESGMRSFFPSINDMVGVKQHLENIKTEWEGREV